MLMAISLYLVAAGPMRLGAQKAQPAKPATSGGNSVLDDINSVFGDGTSQAPAARAQGPAGKAAAAVGSAAIARIGATFDVAGVRLGMPAAVAEKQVMAVDTRFQPRPDDFVLTDMPGVTLRSGITYTQATQTTVHSLTLGLTLAPKTVQVWGIGRIQTFEESELPSLATTLQALRAKYGPEVARDDSEIQHQLKLIWILDENGNAVQGAQAKIVAKACAGVGTSSQSSRSDVTGGWVPSSIDCSTYSFLSARLDEWPPTRRDRGGRLKAPGLLLQLETEAMCYPLRRASYEATTTAAERMMKQREGSEKSKAAQRVPVI